MYKTGLDDASWDCIIDGLIENVLLCVRLADLYRPSRSGECSFTGAAILFSSLRNNSELLSNCKNHCKNLFNQVIPEGNEEGLPPVSIQSLAEACNSFLHGYNRIKINLLP